MGLAWVANASSVDLNIFDLNIFTSLIYHYFIRLHFRYVVQYAAMVGGVVVSCDAYKDLLNRDPAITDTICNRRLPFTFVGDVLMFPQDPRGRNGPDLNRFLRF